MSGFDVTLGLGSLFGSGMSAAASAAIAAKNRKFQERMTRHRYRYQMEDMKLAGLNPMLAMGQSPPGAPPGAAAQIPDFGASFLKGTTAKAQIGLLEEQKRKTGHEADLNAIEARLKQLILEQAEKAADKYGPSAVEAIKGIPGKIGDAIQGGTDWASGTLDALIEGLPDLQNEPPTSARDFELRRTRSRGKGMTAKDKEKVDSYIKEIGTRRYPGKRSRSGRKRN